MKYNNKNVLLEGINAKYCKCDTCRDNGDSEEGSLVPFENFYRSSKGMYGYATRCKEYARKYNLDNKKKIKAYHKNYREENKEKIKEYHKDYFIKNPEKSFKGKYHNNYDFREKELLRAKKNYYKERGKLMKKQYINNTKDIEITVDEEKLYFNGEEIFLDLFARTRVDHLIKNYSLDLTKIIQLGFRLVETDMEDSLNRSFVDTDIKLTKENFIELLIDYAGWDYRYLALDCIKKCYEEITGL